MIRYGFLFLAGLLCIGPSAAQSDNAQSAALPAGAAIRATISSSLDSKKLKQGDKVTAETTAETKMGDKIVMPRGAKLLGHVTHAAARSKGDAYSSVGIVFDKAILKHNQEVPLNVSIEALAAGPQPTVSAAPDMSASPNGMGGGGAPGGAMPGRPGASTTAQPPNANPAYNVENTVGNTDTNNAASGKGAVGGLDNSGLLTPESRGVFGLQGIGLAAGTLGAEPGTVITSTGKEVRLDSGTQMLLITQALVQASK